jgi:hypothetical protein
VAGKLVADVRVNLGSRGNFFSYNKKIITLKRNTLADDIIETCEYLKAW